MLLNQVQINCRSESTATAAVTLDYLKFKMTLLVCFIILRFEFETGSCFCIKLFQVTGMGQLEVIFQW